MLINIIYEVGQEHLADVCEYSLRIQSPTVVVRRINKTSTSMMLNDVDEPWFLCCHAQVLFLLNPLLLMDRAHPSKDVYKISDYALAESPITLWNNSINRITLGCFRLADWVIGDISTTWACSCPHPSPKAIIYHTDMHPDHVELWNNYEEEANYRKNK